MQRSTPFLFFHKIWHSSFAEQGNTWFLTKSGEKFCKKGKVTMNKIKCAIQTERRQMKESAKKKKKYDLMQSKKERSYKKRLDDLYRYIDKIIIDFKKTVKSEKCEYYELKQSVFDTKQIGKGFHLTLTRYTRKIACLTIMTLFDRESFDCFENDKCIKTTKTLGARLTSFIENFFCQVIASNENL